MIPSPELASRIAIWRAKAIEGTLTPEEMREAVLLVRAGRKSAQTASEGAKRSRAKAAVPSAAELLGEMDDL